MISTTIRIIILLIFLTSCMSQQTTKPIMGKFKVEKDLFLPQFDSKTDVDDIHSIAGVTTMLRDSRFAEVKYHAVAGAYGIQEGLYVPANELFEVSFGKNWSDAHANFKLALEEVTTLALKTLNDDGNIWIAEAGQSDFTAALIKNIQNDLPLINTKKRVNVVQHSVWNENSTDSTNLNYVKENSSYNKIPDGNAIGNGSPGLKISETINLKNFITNKKLLEIWDMAIEIANKYNGQEDRYLNSAIADGGLDFSDVSETCWIFGFNDLTNVEHFFKEFSSQKK